MPSSPVHPLPTKLKASDSPSPTPSPPGRNKRTSSLPVRTRGLWLSPLGSGDLNRWREFVNSRSSLMSYSQRRGGVLPSRYFHSLHFQSFTSLTQGENPSPRTRIQLYPKNIHPQRPPSILLRQPKTLRATQDSENLQRALPILPRNETSISVGGG